MSQTLINKGFKPLSQLSVFLGVFGVSLIAAGVVSYGFIALSGLPLMDPQALMQPENIPALRWMQALSTLCIFGLPAVLFAFICYRNGAVAMGFGQKWQWKLAAFAVALIIASGPLTDALGSLNKAIPLPANLRTYFDGMEKTYESQVKAMLDIKNLKGLFISILLIAALPAVVEELFFRSTLQGMFLRWWKNPWVGITVTAFIFSAIHFSWYGFLPRMMLGMVLGLVYYFTGNIWYSILMHFINNLAAVLFMYALQQQGKSADISQTNVFPVWTGILAALVLYLLFRRLYAMQKPQVPKEIMVNRMDPFARPDDETTATENLL